MALYMVNVYPELLRVSFMYGDLSCTRPGQPYRKQGWWALGSGEVFLAWDANLQLVGQYAYFYAQSDQGATWTGPGNHWVEFPANEDFWQCVDDFSNCNKWEDFIEIDFGGHSNYLVFLGPAAGKFSVLAF
jgi:uncharacterized membrane protein